MQRTDVVLNIRDSLLRILFVCSLIVLIEISNIQLFRNLCLKVGNVLLNLIDDTAFLGEVLDGLLSFLKTSFETRNFTVGVLLGLHESLVQETAFLGDVLEILLVRSNLRVKVLQQAGDLVHEVLVGILEAFKGLLGIGDVGQESLIRGLVQFLVDEALQGRFQGLNLTTESLHVLIMGSNRLVVSFKCAL